MLKCLLRLALWPLVILYRLLFSAWTTPSTWTVGQLVTAANLNEQIRDNLNALKDPPSDNIELNESADYTTSSTSFADIDAAGDPDLSLSITTSGGDILVTFCGTVVHSATNGRIYFNITLDGVVQAADDGIFMVAQPAGESTCRYNVSFAYWIMSPSAAAHTIVLQWKTSGATATMYNGAGTSTFDIHPQFVAREVS